MLMIFLAVVVAVVLIFLLNTGRWKKVANSAREGKLGFRREIHEDDEKS